MTQKYQVTTNGYHFGLTQNGIEVLPCNNNRLWRITAGLVGFRQGSLFGIYSLPEERIIQEPLLNAEIPYFRPYVPGKIITRPRYTSRHGRFLKTKAYLETYDHLLWRRNRLYVMGPAGILVIHRNGEVTTYNGKTPELFSSRLNQRCLYQDEYHRPVKSNLKAFRYLEKLDREIDEPYFLKALALKKLNFNPEQLAERKAVNCVQTEKKLVCKQFDYKAIPDLIKERILTQLSTFFDATAHEGLTKAFFFLAWCHANGYVQYDAAGNGTINPLVDLPPKEVKKVVSISSLYEKHGLKKLQHLLYLSPVTNTYLEVLALQN